MAVVVKASKNCSDGVVSIEGHGEYPGTRSVSDGSDSAEPRVAGAE